MSVKMLSITNKVDFRRFWKRESKSLSSSSRNSSGRWFQLKGPT